MLEPFYYQDMLRRDHIRLLCITPGSGLAMIACTLRDYRLSEIEGQYIALSYAWGDNTLNQTIVCNGRSLAVTTGLHEALWQYRENQDSWLLWVDAVCINQKHIDEKNVQVRMMKSIYAKALQVLLWLGPSGLNDKKTIQVNELLNKIGSSKEFHKALECSILDCHSLGLPPLADPIWSAFLFLLKRPWFRRAWIIQEMAVNKNIIFRIGATNVDADLLLNASWVCKFTNVGRLSKYGSNANKPVYDGRLITAPLLEGYRLWVQNGKAAPLHVWLELVRSFNTSDPRDKIFALAGLAEEVDQEFIDYRKTFDQIIIDVAWQAINYANRCTDSNGGVPGLLSRVFWSHLPQNHPSWVMEFTENSGHMSLHCTESFSVPTSLESIVWYFVPSKNCGALTRNNMRLRTTAKCVDAVRRTVETISTSFHEDHSKTLFRIQPYFTLRNMANTTEKWFKEICQVADKYCHTHEGFSTEDGIWRTIVCDSIYTGLRTTNEDKTKYIAWQKWLKACIYYHNNPMLHAKDFLVPEFGFLATILLFYLSRTDTGSDLFSQNWPRLAQITITVAILIWSFGKILNWVPYVWDVNTIDAYADEAADYDAALRRFNSTRKFFVSRSGRMGLLPLLAGSDDLVFVFPGSHIPFVLRPCSDGYRLLGDCYIHDMMDGEFHTGPEPWEVMDIV